MYLTQTWQLLEGAKVGIKCRTEGMRRKISWAHGTTDDYGDFIVHLPSHLHGNPSLESACIVRVVRAPKASPCRGVRVRSKRVKLSSVGNNIRVYTAGVVRLKNAISTTGLCTMRRRHEAENNVLWRRRESWSTVSCKKWCWCLFHVWLE